MSLQEQLLSVTTFIAAVLFFDYLERRRPGFQVERRYELPLNIAAMLTVIFVGEGCKDLAKGGLTMLGMGVLEGNPFTRLPSLPKVLLAVLLTDFSLYWVHRLMHLPRFFFTHNFHHSIGQIWWLSGSRTSVVHLFLFGIPQIFIAYYLLGLSVTESGLAFSFGVVVNLWIHTNIWVDFGPLGKVIVTPNFHRIHHGAKGLTNRNLGFVFTFWDRMFGTYTGMETTGREFALFPVPTQNRLLKMMLGV